MELLGNTVLVQYLQYRFMPSMKEATWYLLGSRLSYQFSNKNESTARDDERFSVTYFGARGHQATQTDLTQYIHSTIPPKDDATNALSSILLRTSLQALPMPVPSQKKHRNKSSFGSVCSGRETQNQNRYVLYNSRECASTTMITSCSAQPAPRGLQTWYNLQLPRQLALAEHGHPP